MRCPSCQFNGTRVVDSRPVDDNKEIRRRRECESCGFRFTTFEKIEETPLVVVKKEGSREEFSREKVLRGLIRACENVQWHLMCWRNLFCPLKRSSSYWKFGSTLRRCWRNGHGPLSQN